MACFSGPSFTLVLGPFLSQSLLQFGASPAVEEMVVQPEKIEYLSDRVIDQIIDGFWMNIERRDRGK